MTKLLAAAMASIAAILFAGPLLAAVLLSTVTAPAVGATIACVDQTGSTVAGGDVGIGALAGAGERGWRAPFEQPYTVSRRGFGRHFHPVHHEWRHHSGQDLVSRPSPGPVVAVAAGVVTHAGRSGGYGNVVDVDHGDGISTRYAHLATINPDITPDTGVHAGQHLGIEGSTGVSTGNHLHFEVHRHGTAIDPVPFMAARDAALVGTATPPTDSLPDSRSSDGHVQPVVAGALEGGVGFDLPPPGQPRRASLVNPPTPIPADVEALYRAAAEEYALPWTVLAGVGMAETNHGRVSGTSSAGALGVMQFLPSTWASMGVDGNGDGRADIGNAADSVFSAAHYLTRSGLTDGPHGVRAALFAYNRADWYVNDVLHYAHAYSGRTGGSGRTVLGDLTDCGPGATHPDNTGNPSLAPLSSERVATMVGWAHAQTGEPYVFGANGPDAWDCSSFTRTALAQVGISAPRTAAAQRDWLAAGNGHRVQLGQERAGDMIFWDSYLGPDRIGHVMLVADPTTQTTIEARSRRHGVGTFSYASGPEHHRFEIWRVGDLSDGTTLHGP